MISVFPSRGLYLTSIFYRDDNVLVTSEDQIPIVEVEDSFSVSLMQDFLWFTKVDTRPYNHRTTGTWWHRQSLYFSGGKKQDYAKNVIYFDIFQYLNV